MVHIWHFRSSKKIEISNFRGVFMRDTLPKQISNKVECEILNLDVSNNSDTHWVCYYKNKDKYYYFDWDNAQNCELIGVGG
jgi:hypothetical protein